MLRSNTSGLWAFAGERYQSELCSFPGLLFPIALPENQCGKPRGLGGRAPIAFFIDYLTLPSVL